MQEIAVTSLPKFRVVQPRYCYRQNAFLGLLTPTLPSEGGSAAVRRGTLQGHKPRHPRYQEAGVLYLLYFLVTCPYLHS